MNSEQLIMNKIVPDPTVSPTCQRRTAFRFPSTKDTKFHEVLLCVTSATSWLSCLQHRREPGKNKGQPALPSEMHPVGVKRQNGHLSIIHCQLPRPVRQAGLYTRMQVPPESQAGLYTRMQVPRKSQAGDLTVSPTCQCRLAGETTKFSIFNNVFNFQLSIFNFQHRFQFSIFHFQFPTSFSIFNFPFSISNIVFNFQFSIFNFQLLCKSLNFS
jgi:hypothetical protein